MLLEREAFLDVLAGPPGRLVLVGGEAGRRQDRAACARSPSGRARACCGAPATRSRPPRPLGPLLDVADAAGGELPRRSPRGARPAALVPGAAAASCAQRPAPCSSLEDVHWADGGTLDVLRLLGRRMGGVPSLVVATFRDDGRSPAADRARRAGHGAPTSRASGSRRSPSRRCARAGRAARRRRRRPAPRAPAATRSSSPRSCSAPAAAIPADRARRGARPRRRASATPRARAARAPRRASRAPPMPELIDAADDAARRVRARRAWCGSTASAVAFRHELARLAVEAEIPPRRRAALHRAVLERLERARCRLGAARAPRRGAPATARRCCGTRVAAAERPRGSARTARRRSSTRARCAGPASCRCAERAELLEHRSYECYLTDQMEEAIAAREEALAAAGASSATGLGEGDARRWLSRLNWFRGPQRRGRARSPPRRSRSSRRCPPGRELAMAYSQPRAARGAGGRPAGAPQEWGERAIDARRAARRARGARARAQQRRHRASCATAMPRRPREARAQPRARARRPASRSTSPAPTATSRRSPSSTASIAARAERVRRRRSPTACDSTSTPGGSTWSPGARSPSCSAGDYDAAAAIGGARSSRIRATALITRIPALVALGLRARPSRRPRGHAELLDEALELARPTGELQRLGAGGRGARGGRRGWRTTPTRAARRPDWPWELARRRGGSAG